MIKPLYQILASLVAQHRNCVEFGNDEWRIESYDRIVELVKNHMPSGSGFDSGTRLEIGKCAIDALVFATSFHHMSGDGYCCGWTEHTVVVRPDFNGIRLTISGRNRDEIKDHIHETFYWALTAKVDDVTGAGGALELAGEDDEKTR